MPETAVQRKKRQLGSIRELLVSRQAEIAAALPRVGVTVERFTRMALLAVISEPKLLACTKESLLQAMLQSAQLGLQPDGVLGDAYLVPFKQKVVFIPGYKGKIKLAYRSDKIAAVNAETIYEGDRYEVELGLHPKLPHTPGKGDRGKGIAYYAVVWLKDGENHPIWKFMTREQVDKHRLKLQSKNADSWRDHFDAMAEKTVLTRALKWAPCSTELQAAIGAEEQLEAGALNVAPLDGEPSGNGESEDEDRKGALEQLFPQPEEAGDPLDDIDPRTIP